ncbi:MAG TPA: winged helix-turn-helix domain-containing protein, partial [Bryobacteraceae bacterium]
MTPTEPRPEQGRRQYCFGEFVLDIESGFLRQGTKELPLQPKAFEVLSYLVERCGRVVSKRELIDAAWHETAVTDNSLSQCIVQIRRALADDSQQLIRTVARRGYVFAAPTTTTIREFPRTVKAPTSEGDSPPVAAPRSRYPTSRVMAAALAIGLAGVVLPTLLLVRKRPEPLYTQITNFADSAAGPALSPDGRMVAFFRSDSGFAAAGPIYVKMLPNGDAVQAADDPRNKYGLAFSPDGSQIAYTAWVGDAKFQWQTFTVPVLGGGQPHLLFANAAGLTWLDERRLLYSEIRSGLHMGIVTSSLTRTDRREIYFPKHERRMAHYSYPSPDRKWALVLEMEPEWLPCRIVPMDGSSLGRQVGPRGACTAAGWSPDGRWMYFGAEVDGAHHLWRQRFPNGKPEQITFGPTEQEGLAVAPDGRSLITSVGMRKGEVWIHDAQGEHAISPEGYAPANYLVLTEPLFSPDGRHVYYLLRRDSPGSENELCRTNLDTRASECVIRGFSILEFDISGTARAPGQLVFSSQRHGGPSEIWLAPLDGSAPPKRIAASGEGSPHFGPDGKLWFRYSDGKANYVGLMNQDGSGRRQASPRPISTVMASSPDGHWLVAMAPASDGAGIVTTAIPADIGGRPYVIGCGRWPLTWARDGRFVYIGLDNDKNETVMIPVPPGEFPEL